MQLTGMGVWGLGWLRSELSEVSMFSRGGEGRAKNRGHGK
jgi:hypothetical protein